MSYQLRGMVERAPSEAWFAHAPEGWVLRLPDPGTALARGGVSVLDLAL